MNNDIDDVVVLSREEYNNLLKENKLESRCEEEMRRVYDDDDFLTFAHKLDVVYVYITNQLDKFRLRADDSFVSIKEVAHYLGIHRRTIQRHMAEGLVTYYKNGHNVRFKIKDVKTAVENRVFKTKIQQLNNLIDNFTPVRNEGSDTSKDK